MRSRLAAFKIKVGGNHMVSGYRQNVFISLFEYVLSHDVVEEGSRLHEAFVEQILAYVYVSAHVGLCQFHTLIYL